MAPILIAQFDVFANPSEQTREIFPFVIVLQSDLLDLDTVVVAPLIQAARMKPSSKLNPVFTINGQAVIMSTGELATLPSKILRQKFTNLGSERDRIIRALDLLFTGV